MPPTMLPSILPRFELVCEVEVDDEPVPDAVCEKVDDKPDLDAVGEKVDDELDANDVGEKLNCEALAITTDPVTSGLSERHEKMSVWTESKCPRTSYEICLYGIPGVTCL
jgi:hypothetical protein